MPWRWGRIGRCTMLPADWLPLTVARACKRCAGRAQPDLVLLGKQSIDSDNSQVGQMLAALNDWPLATFASAIRLVEELQVTRRDRRWPRGPLGMALPAVVTVDLRLNEPRFLPPNIAKKAKRKAAGEPARSPPSGWCRPTRHGSSG